MGDAREVTPWLRDRSETTRATATRLSYEHGVSTPIGFKGFSNENDADCLVGRHPLIPVGAMHGVVQPVHQDITIQCALEVLVFSNEIMRGVCNDSLPADLHELCRACAGEVVDAWGRWSAMARFCAEVRQLWPRMCTARQDNVASIDFPLAENWRTAGVVSTIHRQVREAARHLDGRL